MGRESVDHTPPVAAIIPEVLKKYSRSYRIRCKVFTGSVTWLVLLGSLADLPQKNVSK